LVAVGYREDATAHRTETPPVVGIVPAHDGYGESGQKVGMAMENAEAAALILRAHGDDVRFVDYDGYGGRDQESHEVFTLRFTSASFSQASSIVPTMNNELSAHASQAPARIARQPSMVSANGTDRPGLPVKASVTAKGCVRKRSSRRALATMRRSRALSSSIPRREMTSCNSL